MSAQCGPLTGQNNHLRDLAAFSPDHLSKIPLHLNRFSGLASCGHSDVDQTHANLPEAAIVTLLETSAPSSSDSSTTAMRKAPSEAETLLPEASSQSSGRTLRPRVSIRRQRYGQGSRVPAL
jgi:hypothetical protein